MGLLQRCFLHELRRLLPGTPGSGQCGILFEALQEELQLVRGDLFAAGFVEAGEEFFELPLKFNPVITLDLMSLLLALESTLEGVDPLLESVY